MGIVSMEWMGDGKRVTKEILLYHSSLHFTNNMSNITSLYTIPECVPYNAVALFYPHLVTS